MERKIVKAVGFVGASSIISQFFGFIFFVVLARYYSQHNFGLINYTISVGTIAATIIAAGFPSALVRYISKYHESQEKIDEYFTNIILVTFVLLILVLVGSIVIYGFNVGILCIIIGYSIVYIYLGVIRGFISYQKLAYFNIGRNAIKLIFLVVVSYLLDIKSPIFVILLYSFGGWILILYLEGKTASTVHYIHKKVSYKKIVEVTKYSAPIMVSMLAYTALTNIPIIAIKTMNGNFESVGIYSTASTLTMIFTFVPTALATIIMPSISKTESKTLRTNYIKKSLFFVSIAGILLYIFIFIFGKTILIILFTEKYVESYPILLILSFGAIFGGLRNTFCTLWEGTGNPIIATYDMVIASLICIAGSVILIPIVGPVGAAYGYSLGLFASICIDFAFWIKFRSNKLILQ